MNNATHISVHRRELFQQGSPCDQALGENRVGQVIRMLAVFLFAVDTGQLHSADPYGAGHDYAVFQSLDADGSGHIENEEREIASRLLGGLDQNDDGELDQTELGGPGPFFGYLRLQTTIRVMDRDGDCKISAIERQQAAIELSRLDENGDGRLSRVECYDPRTRLGGGQTKANPSEGVGPMLEQIINFPRYSNNIPPGANPRAYEGYFLYSESGVSSDVQINTGTFLLDTNGTQIHHWPTDRYMPEGTGAYLLDSGMLLRQVAPGDWLTMKNFTVGSHGIVEMVDWEGNVVWEYSRRTFGEHVLHHDMEYLPNGNILVLSYEARSPAEVSALGGVSTEQIRWFEKILEIKPNLTDGSTSLVWEWDSTRYMTSEDGDRAAGKLAIGVKGAGERQLHFNSIDYHPQRNWILVSSLIYGEVFIIDRATGKIIDRWGKGVLGGQHDARWLDENVPHRGDFLVHNNRDGRLKGVEKAGPFGLGAFHSAILEVKLGDQHREAEVVWEYKPDPIESWYGPFMSGANRLPNGNTLVINSFNRRVFEVDPNKMMVLDFHIPGPGRVFRVYKLRKDHPGLEQLSVR
ncbi:MAG: aryl-sulfate sulfotransferase [Planctomycetota bacterium]